MKDNRSQFIYHNAFFLENLGIYGQVVYTFMNMSILYDPQMRGKTVIFVFLSLT